MKIDFVFFSNSFLELSWIWLNDIEIRELTNTPIFTREYQLRWYKGLKSKKNYFIWGIKVDNEKIGVCGIKNITSTDCEYWGYIGNKKYWGKGIGSLIITEMEQKAKEMGIQSIWLKVLPNNVRAIRLYEKMNFKNEITVDDLLIMRKELN